MDAVHLTDRNFSYEYGYRVDTTTGNSTIDSVDWVENQRRIKEAMGKIADLERAREQVAIFDFDGEQADREPADRVADALRRSNEELQQVSAKTENLIETLRPYKAETVSNDSAVWVAHS